MTPKPVGSLPAKPHVQNGQQSVSGGAHVQGSHSEKAASNNPLATGNNSSLMPSTIWQPNLFPAVSNSPRGLNGQVDNGIYGLLQSPANSGLFDGRTAPSSTHGSASGHSGNQGSGPAATGGHGTSSATVPNAGPGTGTMAGVLNLAASRIGVHEIRTSNRGPEVDSYQRSAGLSVPDKPYDGTTKTEGQPWCMAFIYDTFAKNHMTQVNGQPILTRTGSCQVQANFAAKHGRLVSAHDAQTQMKPGWVMLKWEEWKDKKGVVHGRYAHSGIVTRVNPDGTFDTIEGNTNSDGAREGVAVLPKTRNLRELARDKHPVYAFIRTTP